MKKKPKFTLDDCICFNCLQPMAKRCANCGYERNNTRTLRQMIEKPRHLLGKGYNDVNMEKFLARFVELITGEMK